VEIAKSTAASASSAASDQLIACGDVTANNV
jgi:hypothetical protein